ncbi:hypothetical protein DAPPUDRAFT_266011 [Daphnia pulex]|uniref:Uncharacterized protein n=1 Tax=Daphnia pulex TaxID=6669 RepID=E9HUC5_DAPPU|nr:hypothetical protein DAPPUDRAFT_266011 [Daphnia pulex]|eukprot:EFX64657.1 hypothetical protein DAPPUDRAFT_266011 [Daphnia pulex]
MSSATERKWQIENVSDKMNVCPEQVTSEQLPRPNQEDETQITCTVTTTAATMSEGGARASFPNSF